MKINGPVQCQSFFKDQIQQGQEGLWCVSLKPNGQLDELIGKSSITSQDCQDLLCKLSFKKISNKQLLFVRISLSQSLFDEQDWSWVEEILSFVKAYEIIFCDYLKLSKECYTSLIRYENQL